MTHQQMAVASIVISLVSLGLSTWTILKDRRMRGGPR